jgi:hypothetical protein
MYRAGAGGTEFAALGSSISHGTRLPVVKGCSAFSCMPTSFLFPSQVIFSTFDDVIPNKVLRFFCLWLMIDTAHYEAP